MMKEIAYRSVWDLLFSPQLMVYPLWVWIKAKGPPTNGICETFHKTVLNEFYRVTFRKRSTDRSMSHKPNWKRS